MQSVQSDTNYNNLKGPSRPRSQPVKIVQFKTTKNKKDNKSETETTEEEEDLELEQLEFLGKIFGTATADSQQQQQHRYPLIIKGCNIGPCTVKWTEDYLKNVNPTKLVKVHESYSPQFDFRNKNFKYQIITFSKLVDYCSQSQTQVVSDIPGEKVLEDTNSNFTATTNTKTNCTRTDSNDGELESCQPGYYYLRSLGEDPRGKDISDLSIHFPELYKDLRIPQFFPKTSFFSSVFRISSASLQLWTHYDTCDNILIQIKGRKRIVFFPPWEALNLYLDGDKSQVLDIDNPNLEVYPQFANVQRLEGILEEGDIVYIPSLWFHNVTALNFSVSVNVFWRNLDHSLYDKKDTYGNHDVIPAQLCFRTLDKAILQLKFLPTEYQDFYLKRMIISLQKRLDGLQLNIN